MICTACERGDHSEHFEKANPAFRCLNLPDDETFCECDIDTREIPDIEN